MAESMRGSRLGATSYEVDNGISVPRVLTTYVCPDDHRTTLPFFAEADEIPDIWECECGQTGLRMGAVMPDMPAQRVLRSHMDMIRERRDENDLGNALDEVLRNLRGANVVVNIERHPKSA
jgi:hypothetical protein